MPKQNGNIPVSPSPSVHPLADPANFVCVKLYRANSIARETREDRPPGHTTSHLGLRNSLEVCTCKGKIQFICWRVGSPTIAKMCTCELEGSRAKSNTATYERRLQGDNEILSQAMVNQDSKIGDCDFGAKRDRSESTKGKQPQARFAAKSDSAHQQGGEGRLGERR